MPTADEAQGWRAEMLQIVDVALRLIDDVDENNNNNNNQEAGARAVEDAMWHNRLLPRYRQDGDDQRFGYPFGQEQMSQEEVERVEGQMYGILLQQRLLHGGGTIQEQPAYRTQSRTTGAGTTSQLQTQPQPQPEQGENDTPGSQQQLFLPQQEESETNQDGGEAQG